MLCQFIIYLNSQQTNELNEPKMCQPPAKKCDISADHLLCEDCDECKHCLCCSCDIHCVDDMDFGTRSDPCCGICSIYANNVEWVYCGELDDCDSDFDEDEQPDEDFIIAEFQGSNLCDGCADEYIYDNGGDCFNLKTKYDFLKQ